MHITYNSSPLFSPSNLRAPLFLFRAKEREKKIFFLLSSPKHTQNTMTKKNFFYQVRASETCASKSTLRLPTF
jgi:hypothetical protein